MIKDLVQTDSSYVYLFLRVVAGVIIFPYGMQKLFGWFDDLGGGVGIHGSLEQLRKKKIPMFIGWLIILGQSLGSLMLIFGCLARIAAAANLIIFTGAVIVHASDGWTMNWLGKKKGEGVEYFVLLLSILLVIIFKGSGAVSIDIWIAKYL
jgi:putative oxidoreductase